MLNNCGTVTSIVHDARSFYLDLTAELRRLHSPRYPQREFFRALESADRMDLARAVTARNASGETDYFDRQHSCEFTDLDYDPKYLNSGYSPEKTAQRATHARRFTKIARAARAEGVCTP